MHLNLVLFVGLALAGTLASADDVRRSDRERRSSYPQQKPQQQQQPAPTYQQEQQGSQSHLQEAHQKQDNSYKPKKRCYQCAYSPPKTIHTKKTVHVAQQGHAGQGYGQQEQQQQYVSQTLHGGWDKCLGPFDHYQAKAYGVDTWDCHSGNCYVRRDPNGDVFRGCFKGEYGVDQHRYGCHFQGGSTYCFCEGELCNNGAAPQGQH